MIDKIKAWFKAEGLGVQIAAGILAIVVLLIVVSALGKLF